MDENSLAHPLVTLWLCALTLLGTVAAAPTSAEGAPCVDVDAAPRSTGAQPRIALVIGNFDYESLSDLKTSEKDAGEVAKALSKLGFKVRRCHNASLEAMRVELDRFSKDLKSDRNPNALAFFYFAGHGLRGLGDRDGENYMLPVEFDVGKGREKLRQRAIWLHQDIVKAMPKRGPGDSGANVIILDACREDEIGSDDGLWQIDPDPDRLPPGTLVAFAAQPAKASFERKDLTKPERISVYTEKLVEGLRTVGSNIGLEGLFKGVRQQVYEASNKSQQPEIMANLADNEIFLAAGKGTRPRYQGELKLWDFIKERSALCAFEEYLEHFPNGQFVVLAGDKLQKISERQAAEKLVAPQLPESMRREFRKKWAASEAWCDNVKLSEKISELKAFPKNHPNSAHDRVRGRLRLRQTSGARGPREKNNGEYVRRPVRVQLCQGMQRAKPFNALWRFAPGYSSGKRCPRAGECRAKRYQQARWTPKLNAWQAGTGYGVRAAVHRRGTGGYDYPDRLSRYRGSYIAGAQPISVQQLVEDPPPRRTWIAQTDGPATQHLLKVRSTGSPIERPDDPSEAVKDAEFRQDLVKAEQGDKHAMYSLALAYEKRRDTGKMLRWLLVSSAMGNGRASYQLGRYYAARKGGYFNAVKYRSLARNQGYTPPVGLREER